MYDSTESSNAALTENVLSEAKDVLDRLIVAVDFLVSTANEALDSDTADLSSVLSRFDEALFQEDFSPFANIHLSPCTCHQKQMPVDEEDSKQTQVEELEADPEVDDEAEVPYMFVEDFNNNEVFPSQNANVSFDDVLLGLLAIPPVEHEVMLPMSESSSSEEDMLVVMPVRSDEAGDGDEDLEALAEIDFLERMLFYFRETDMLLDEEQQGSGDHSQENGLE